MTTITVRFYTLWRQYLGIDKVSIEVDNLEDALKQVDNKYGSILREKLHARGTKLDGRIEDYSLVLLNNTNLRNLKERSIREGDVLHIFPPVMGG